MSAALEVEPTLTDHWLTTLRDTVRRAPRLGKRDKIHYPIRLDGEVVLTRAAAGDGEAPTLAAFLGFLSSPDRAPREAPGSPLESSCGRCSLQELPATRCCP